MSCSDACPPSCTTDCADVCFNEAVHRNGTVVRIDAGRCAGCGACVGACRDGLIALVDGVARLCPD